MPVLFGILTINSQAQIAAWDFTGEGSTTNSNSVADVYNVNSDASNLLTRGAGAAYSSGGNSFRTVGFKNDGISTSNTDYFEFTAPDQTKQINTGKYAKGVYFIKIITAENVNTQKIIVQ